MGAHDICLMVPSPAALQKLINICYCFSVQNNLLTLLCHFVWCVNLDCINYCFLRFIWTLRCLIILIYSIKYLGFTFSSDKKDDNDMLRQMRILYTKSNRLFRLFHCCLTDVKLPLVCGYYACYYLSFYGLIIRSLLTVKLELLLTMSIVAHYNYLQGVVPALCMQLITLIVLKF